MLTRSIFQSGHREHCHTGWLGCSQKGAETRVSGNPTHGILQTGSICITVHCAVCGEIRDPITPRGVEKCTLISTPMSFDLSVSFDSMDSLFS